MLDSGGTYEIEAKESKTRTDSAPVQRSEMEGSKVVEGEAIELDGEFVAELDGSSSLADKRLRP